MDMSMMAFFPTAFAPSAAMSSPSISSISSSASVSSPAFPVDGDGRAAAVSLAMPSSSSSPASPVTASASSSLLFHGMNDFGAFMAPAGHSTVTAVSGAMSAAAMGEEIPPSAFLEELLDADEFAGHPSFGAAPMLLAAGAPTHESSGLSAARLSQLEDNYERKKKRAKINRRDLNSRFQELMEVLHLREDRKLNRAKILERAIEHIHELTDELQRVKAQLSSQSNANAPLSTAPRRASAPSPATQVAPPMPLPPWQRRPAPHALSLPPSAPAPVMWMPCPVIPAASPRVPVPRPRGVTAAAALVYAPASASTPAPAPAPAPIPAPAPAPARSSTPQTTTDTALVPRRSGLKRARETSQQRDHAFLWVVQEVPTLLELCDAWSLTALLATSRDIREAVTVVKRLPSLWRQLCLRRWRVDLPLDGAATDPTAYSNRWLDWHRRNQLPQGIASASVLPFASGRRTGIALWAALVRRSNGRTTRTVLVDGRAVVRQVVELRVVVQNVHPVAAVQLSDHVVVRAVDGTALRLISSDARAHLTSTVLSINAAAVANPTLATDVTLRHNDCCVLSVFVDCDGLDLEDQFLQRVLSVSLRCNVSTLDAPIELSAASFGAFPSTLKP
ncbi:hypothetical protein ATCC90586_006079 [Pythium insidiosum]|nr:hypothetical protein ATCC90586_006079 [Pythium insidiosum]